MPDLSDGRSESEHGPQLWKTAAGFQDLCQLGAAFLRGEIEQFPGWGASSTDEETDALVPILCALQQMGFLTVASQSGHTQSPAADGRSEKRRAFVLGFAGERAVSMLASIEDASIRSLSGPATTLELEEFELGMRGQDCFMGLNREASRAELELFRGEISAAAFAELQATHFVALLDTVWDRGDHLWAVLSEALARFSEHPTNA